MLVSYALVKVEGFTWPCFWCGEVLSARVGF